MRASWPLRRADGAKLLAVYAALSAIFVAIGLLLTHAAQHSAMVAYDDRLERWFVARRTPGWNTASWWGSQLSETGTKVVVTALVCAALAFVQRRWLEVLVVAVPLVVEAAAFLTVTLVVGRPRPDVARLDGSPVGSSFPSGHTAAAACYAGMAVVIALHARRRRWPALAMVLVAAVTLAVGLARMYRGMHHLTDVVAGTVLGAASVAACTLVVLRADRRRPAQRAAAADDHPAVAAG